MGPTGTCSLSQNQIYYGIIPGKHIIMSPALSKGIQSDSVQLTPECVLALEKSSSHKEQKTICAWRANALGMIKPIITFDANVFVARDLLKWKESHHH